MYPIYIMAVDFLHLCYLSIARPEFVGVLPDPDYRGKRFQKHIMDALHARAKVDNNLVQVISGIAWVSEILFDGFDVRALLLN
jgi:hypothetical protein